MAVTCSQRKLINLFGVGVLDTHKPVQADSSESRKNGKESDEAGLPDTDSTMAFIFSVSSSVSRWTDCCWNLRRVSWPICA